MRRDLRNWMIETRDAGLLPESEMHARSADSTPYETAHDPRKYPLERILETAEMASSLDRQKTPALIGRLSDADSAVRYWAAMGLLMRGETVVREARQPLQKMLKDSAPAARIIAAEALGRYSEADRQQCLDALIQLAPADKNGVYLSIQALNGVSAIGRHARRVREAIANLETKDPKAHARLSSYVPRLVETLTADLGAA
jgi:uncharacterized sulfatase